MYYQKKVRYHNRQIHKNTIFKGGYRKRNQAPYEVMGFRLYDKVSWKQQVCFIFGRRTTGRMDLRLLDGTKVNASVGYKNLRMLELLRIISVKNFAPMLMYHSVAQHKKDSKIPYSVGFAVCVAEKNIGDYCRMP